MKSLEIQNCKTKWFIIKSWDGNWLVEAGLEVGEAEGSGGVGEDGQGLKPRRARSEYVAPVQFEYVEYRILEK